MKEGNWGMVETGRCALCMCMCFSTPYMSCLAVSVAEKLHPSIHPEHRTADAGTYSVRWARASLLDRRDARACTEYMAKHPHFPPISHHARTELHSHQQDRRAWLDGDYSSPAGLRQ